MIVYHDGSARGSLDLHTEAEKEQWLKAIKQMSLHANESPQ